jgi:virulence factor Mce-like protein
MYQKRFVDVVHVSLQTDRIGNQLTTHADVKIRGIVIGEVRQVRSTGEGATLDLALDPKKAAEVPADVRAQLLPKTLFGEKQVVLVPPAQSSSGHLRDGDVIPQDRSATAMETEQALNDLLPLLKALRPQELSTFLTNVATSLRGRGERLGSSFQEAGAYFARINPQLPASGADLQGLADLAQNLQRTSPDLLRELDNLAASSRNITAERASLDAFLRSTSDFAGTTGAFVRENQQRFVALARDSVDVLRTYAAYAPSTGCFLNRLAFQETEGERVFGGGQPGLHITLELTKDHGGYVPGDEPKYKEKRNFGCFGLGKKPIRPMPEYANTQDGYRDNEPPADPGTGPNGCCQNASWQGEVAAPSAVVARRELPVGTTVLDALMLAPITGSS